MTCASAWERIKAFTLDYLIMFAYLVVLAGVGSLLTFGPPKDWWARVVATPARTDLVAFTTAVLPVILYFALCEASESGATWGKRRVGIRVAVSSGASPGLTRALLRSALKFLPWQLAHTAMLHIPGFPVSPGEPPVWTTVLLVSVWVLVAVYLAGITRLGGYRALYDRVAGTMVVHANRRSSLDGPVRKSEGSNG